MARSEDLLIAALVPGRCLHCRGPARWSDPLCGACRAGLPWLPVDGCPRCALPVRCAAGRCPAERAAFSAAWAPLGYDGPARTLAWAQKERATGRLARWLAATMVVRGPSGWLAGASLVVPVPSDPHRRRRRGTDHAGRLATEVGARLGLPVGAVLARPRRSGPTVAQRRLSRRERSRLPPPRLTAPVRGTVLLIDDVHTTGSTLHGAARALRDGGATRVLALTAFRAE